MERNVDRKTLSFNLGVTNVPSDLLCDDNSLLECDGFISKDGSLMPVQKPKLMTSIPYKLQYVHKGADYKNLIAYDETNGKLYCYLCSEHSVGDIKSTQSFVVSSLYDVKSVGNTLVCATGEGIRYLLYKGGKYKDLGTELPSPTFEPYLKSDNKNWIKGCSPANLEGFLANEDCKCEYDSNGNLCTVEYLVMQSDFARTTTKVSITSNTPASYCKYHCFYIDKNNEQNISNVQDAIKGHVSGQINRVRGDNRFAFPFYVRFALRLYDGTYTKISNPIIMYPSVRKNNMVYPVKKFPMSNSTGELTYTLANGEDASYLYAYDIKSCVMKFKASFPGANDWTDIVKGISVFASEEVLPFYLDEKWVIAYPNELHNQTYYDKCIGGKYENSLYKFDKPFGANAKGIYPFTTFLPVFKTDAQIEKELLYKSVFYKLFEINTSTNEYIDGTEHDASNLIELHTVENLNTQAQLGKDDYYAWAKLQASKLFTYNKRLNIFGAKRYPFQGFRIFRGIESSTNGSGYIQYYVHIESDSMDTWVASPVLTIPNDFEIYDDWYYYPDPNAIEMLILVNKEGAQCYYNVKLKTHPMLNGSYSFNALPITAMSTGISKNLYYDGFEDLNSQIFTSVVNNPFVFEASGDNTIGTGKILDIVANTEAVSQGQFGQYPLLVFTDEGIYGMSVNSEGLYSATYPISREACLENSPLVPTDKLIFFASKKGLMAASGGSVGCMSEQLRGRTPLNFTTLGSGSFIDFMKDCLIAYDYRDSMLRIFGKDKDYQYIYNMVDKTFSMVNSGIMAQSVVNDYPDNLIQDTNGNIYSLIEKPDINDDTNLYNGSITTRPLKLGGSLTLKSLRDIKNLRSTQTGKLQLEVWGSNNAVDWCKLYSLKGKPWSYFTFRYTLTNFKACDSFAGSVVHIQNRRELR